MALAIDLRTSGKNDKALKHIAVNLANEWIDTEFDDHSHYIGGLAGHRETFIELSLCNAINAIGGELIHRDHKFKYDEGGSWLIPNSEPDKFTVTRI